MCLRVGCPPYSPTAAPKHHILSPCPLFASVDSMFCMKSSLWIDDKGWAKYACLHTMLHDDSHTDKAKLGLRATPSPLFNLGEVETLGHVRFILISTNQSNLTCNTVTSRFKESGHQSHTLHKGTVNSLRLG